MKTIKKVTALKAENTDMVLKQYPRAKDLSLILCHCCGLLNSSKVDKVVAAKKNKVLRCVRCHSVLHERKQGSLNRTFALVVAATILYIPANVLPMTITDSLLGSQKDTIMSGVIYFWQNGDYLVSVVIFMASIFIPMLKLFILYFLLLVVYIQSSAAWKFSPEQCIKLYRIVEFVGRWSMIDVFVVALLTALIQIQSLATILAGPGSIAFGAVVVLTMFASLSFDPRIIWDNFYASQNTNKPNDFSSEKTTVIQAEHSSLNNDSINPSQ
ncbi:paraquat-inducible protein A [Acinetobacter genomosp. 33YU]|uniref:paraquat-inducible protein A n=1 Tax=Acinetobacter TaxID=469 RepID=UPI00097F96ED|nr:MULTISPECIES: paraquat-inducible protein A [Acinetobacter]ONN50761.1 paraquat-inducible protein A [Acinetobacter genomosp. 33YU]PJG68440.1 paraquat-inducible membrane protein A [Acinetobacter seifertii]